MDLNSVHLEMELQSETPEVVGTNEVIDINSTCSEVEHVEITVVVTANIDKM